ncbi:MAG: hypothetical protein SF162_11340 [bacterium]|nr:hypothetical protein [bacterium]
MTSEIYFPDHRHLHGVMLIQRERALPDDVDGSPERPKNARVSFRDVVARGVRPAPYIVVDAARELKLRRPEALDRLLRVDQGQDVNRGQVLAGKVRRNGDPVRRRSVVAPRGGTVVYIGQGRIIIQETADSVEVESGVNGTVISVVPGRGVTVETYAAALQGVWGNGQRAIGILKPEPDDGLESIFGDQVDNAYRGAVVFTRRAIKAITLRVIADQGLVGVIAPSMEPALIDTARSIRAPILLTEGFGAARMNTTYFQFLSENTGRQVMLDAVEPGRVNAYPPEALITVPLAGSERPSSPVIHAPLRVGSTVNVISGEGLTMTGRVTDLPKTPVLLDNGLRVACGLVELSTGEIRHVPLANIEVYG